jgi:hypothetical protein
MINSLKPQMIRITRGASIGVDPHVLGNGADLQKQRKCQQEIRKRFKTDYSDVSFGVFHDLEINCMYLFRL